MWAAHKPFATILSSFVVPVLGQDGYAQGPVRLRKISALTDNIILMHRYGVYTILEALWLINR
jgi:hypothetical protein